MQLNAITRKSALVAILLLVVILIASTLRYALSPFEVELANCQYRGRVVSLIVAVLIFLFGGIIEGKIFPRSGLSKGYCTLPIPLYGLLSCGILFQPYTIPTAVLSLAFAMAIFMLLRSLHSADERSSLFFSAILLGSMVLLNPATILLAGVIPIAIFMLALTLRQAVIMIGGYLLPLFSASYIMWYRGDDFIEFGRNVCEVLATPRMEYIAQLPIVATIMISAVVAILLWGMIYAAIRPDKIFSLARIRHSLYLFIIITLLSLAMLLFPSCDLSLFAVVAVPMGVLLSFVLSILPNNQSTIAYWVLLALFVLHLFIE